MVMTQCNTFTMVRLAARSFVSLVKLGSLFVPSAMTNPSMLSKMVVDVVDTAFGRPKIFELIANTAVFVGMGAFLSKFLVQIVTMDFAWDNRAASGCLTVAPMLNLCGSSSTGFRELSISSTSGFCFGKLMTESGFSPKRTDNLKSLSSWAGAGDTGALVSFAGAGVVLHLFGAGAAAGGAGRFMSWTLFGIWRVAALIDDGLSGCSSSEALVVSLLSLLSLSSGEHFFINPKMILRVFSRRSSVYATRIGNTDEYPNIQGSQNMNSSVSTCPSAYHNAFGWGTSSSCCVMSADRGASSRCCVMCTHLVCFHGFLYLVGQLIGHLVQHCGS